MLATSGNPQRGGSVATTGGGEASGGGLQRTAAARRGRLGQRSQEWPSVAQPYVSAYPTGAMCRYVSRHARHLGAGRVRLTKDHRTLPSIYPTGRRRGGQGLLAVERHSRSLRQRARGSCAPRVFRRASQGPQGRVVLYVSGCE